MTENENALSELVLLFYTDQMKYMFVYLALIVICVHLLNENKKKRKDSIKKTNMK